MNSRALSLLQSTPVKGAVVGLAATQALDVVSTYIYERESPALLFRENLTRGFLHAYERAIVKMGDAVGKHVSRRDARRWGWRFHKAFGVMGGLQYIALRNRKPSVGRLGGLLFGAAFFVIADEILMPALRLTPGPTKFSWKVHARGAIAHALYGVAAEMTARLIDRMGQRTEAESVEVDLTTLEIDLASAGEMANWVPEGARLA